MPNDLRVCDYSALGLKILELSTTLEYASRGYKRDTKGRFAKTGSTGSANQEGKGKKEATSFESIKNLGAKFAAKYEIAETPSKEEKKIAKSYETAKKKIESQIAANKQLKQKDIDDFKEKEKALKDAQTEREKTPTIDAERMRNDLLNYHGISEEKAKEWSSSIKQYQMVEGGGIGKPLPDRFLKDFEDIYRMSGGKVDTLKSVTIDNVSNFGRAYAKVENGSITLPTRRHDGCVANSIFHETAHHIEFSRPEVQKASQEFIQSRATSLTPQKLSDITGRKHFADSEVALPGKFIHPYVGKIYEEQNGIKPSEVVSMGVQDFSHPSSMKSLYTEDREHFNYALGVLLSGRDKT